MDLPHRHDDCELPHLYAPFAVFGLGNQYPNPEQVTHEILQRLLLDCFFDCLPRVG